MVVLIHVYVPRNVVISVDVSPSVTRSILIYTCVLFVHGADDQDGRSETHISLVRAVATPKGLRLVILGGVYILGENMPATS